MNLTITTTPTQAKLTFTVPLNRRPYLNVLPVKGGPSTVNAAVSDLVGLHDLPDDDGVHLRADLTWYGKGEGVPTPAPPARSVFDFVFYGAGSRLGSVPGTRKTWSLKPSGATPAEVDRLQQYIGPDGLVWLDHPEPHEAGYLHWSEPASLDWWVKALTPIKGKVGLYGIPMNGAMGVFDDAWRASSDKYDSVLVPLVCALMPQCYFKYTVAEFPPEYYPAFVREMTVEAIRLRDKYNPAAKVYPVLSPRNQKTGEFMDLVNWRACIAECRKGDGVLLWDDGPIELAAGGEPLIAAAVEALR